MLYSPLISCDVSVTEQIHLSGYANEVGESFRPIFPRKYVQASYAVAVAYTIGDTVDKSYKKYKVCIKVYLVFITQPLYFYIVTKKVLLLFWVLSLSFFLFWDHDTGI